METRNIKSIIYKVIVETMESIENEEYFNPASEIEEMIPEFRRMYLDKPDYDEISAVYYMVDYWADAVRHNFNGIGCKDYPVSTYEAEKYLLEAALVLKQNMDLADSRIVDWYKRCIRRK
jgi:hypothetical protein